MTRDRPIELDAIAPDDQPAMVRAAIEQHLSPDRFKILQAAEASERELIAGLARKVGQNAEFLL
jgi:hypothetical protein